MWARSAQEEALAKVMQDLDEKINKAKKCKLDDMYSAVALLDAKEQHVSSRHKPNKLAPRSCSQMQEGHLGRLSIAFMQCCHVELPCTTGKRCRACADHLLVLS